MTYDSMLDDRTHRRARLKCDTLQLRDSLRIVVAHIAQRLASSKPAQL